MSLLSIQSPKNGVALSGGIRDYKIQTAFYPRFFGGH